ncbi:hypothetical protein OQA88_5512 [Cercophora sp. LCS_1]
MHLLAVADELLVEIAKQLAPTCDGTGSYPLHADLARCHWQAELLALTRTNHRLNAIRTPYLYHAVRIHDLRSLLNLLRCFVQSDLARFVRILDIDTRLPVDATVEYGHEIFKSITPAMRAYLHSLPFQELEDPSSLALKDHCPGYGESARLLVLPLTAELQTHQSILFLSHGGLRLWVAGNRG